MAQKNQPVEVLGDEVETVTEFCYLRDRPNASGRCKTAVISRVRIKWTKSGMWRVVSWKKVFLRRKGMVYRSCVKSATLHRSETWRLRESEMAILRRTETAMVRSNVAREISG